MNQSFVLAVLWVTFCSHRAAVAPTPRPFPCDGIVHSLTTEETSDAQYKARDEIKAALIDRTLTAPHPERLSRSFPKVEYVACDWWATGDLGGGTHPVTTWIAGMTFFKDWKIRVRTNEPTRTAPLVRWETINAYLMEIGRPDLTDIWQGRPKSLWQNTKKD